MTRLYLDTEFNGYGGELISLALYDPAGGRSFYEVVKPQMPIAPWVAEHVMPKLGRDPIPGQEFRARLRHFLMGYMRPVIIADWPADFVHLFDSIMIEGQWTVDIPLQAHLIESGAFESTNPHNALMDAEALARWHIESTAAESPQ